MTFAKSALELSSEVNDMSNFSEWHSLSQGMQSASGAGGIHFPTMRSTYTSALSAFVNGLRQVLRRFQ